MIVKPDLSSFAIVEHFYQQTCPWNFTSRELCRKTEGISIISKSEIAVTSSHVLCSGVARDVRAFHRKRYRWAVCPFAFPLQLTRSNLCPWSDSWMWEGDLSALHMYCFFPSRFKNWRENTLSLTSVHSAFIRDSGGSGFYLSWLKFEDPWDWKWVKPSQLQLKLAFLILGTVVPH